MMETMKNTRRIVIKSIMKDCVENRIDVNEGIRKITAFDKEAQIAFEAVTHWQQVCMHYTEDGNVLREIGG